MLTTQTHAPYNRSDMSVDDPALDAAIRRHEERLARDPTSLAFAQLADLYRKAGRTREAVALCRNGLDARLRYALPRAGLRRGGRPGVHPNPPEGSRQSRGPRAPGDDAPRTGATERLERDARVNRGVQEGVAHRVRWQPVHDRGV